jgi:AraC-like DNA-binding protein
VKDWAVWSRVSVPAGPPLDLLHAKVVREFARHSHDEYAIGACTGGLEAISYRGGMHYSGPGTVVVLEPGQAHTGGPAEVECFTYRVMYPAVSLVGKAHFAQPVIYDPELARRLADVHRMLGEGRDGLEGESRLVAVFGDLVARHASEPPAHTRTHPGLAAPVMARLADGLIEPPTLAELAAEHGLSRYQLLRGFTDEVGMPPYAWLAQHRVAKARVLLERGGRPAEVATAVGFADQAHLTRWFRRVLMVTPAAYRNSVQDVR